MPKMQVYLPDELHARVKARGDALNVSAVLQRALAEHLDDLDRMDALKEALDDYQAEFGEFTQEELLAQEEADRRNAIWINPDENRSGVA